MRKAIRALDRRASSIFRRLIWPVLPSYRHLKYNGVFVRHRKRLLSGVVPERWLPVPQFDIPTFESASVEGLKRVVRRGDTVVVVGGGTGVTAVIAARLSAGLDGSVTCFEGAKDRVRYVREAAELNSVDNLQVVHAVVGATSHLFGDADGCRLTDPKDLPNCQVLEMDCEGAEISILRQMVIRPRAVVVETHGLFGAATMSVREALEDLGYRVVDLGVAVAHKRAYCEAHDIRVLVGEQQGAA